LNVPNVMTLDERSYVRLPVAIIMQLLLFVLFYCVESLAIYSHMILRHGILRRRDFRRVAAHKMRKPLTLNLDVRRSTSQQERVDRAKVVFGESMR